MKNFSFIKNRFVFLAISIVLIVLGVLSIVMRGFNVDIDFIGGTELTYDAGVTLSYDDIKNIESAVKEIVGEDMFSSIRNGGDNNEQIIIRTKVISSDESGTESREQISEKITEMYENAILLSADNVSAEVSGDLKESAIVSTVLAVLLMLVYIAFRFQISSAFAAVICLLHDVFIMVVAYSVFQIPVNSTIIAALLTILGYSINATIIIFDRVRENEKLLGRNVPFADKVDVSIKQTFTRSLNTTFTTLFTIGMVYILGVTSIRDFALPLIVGVIAGLYSSVCLSGVIWHSLRKKSR